MTDASISRGKATPLERLHPYLYIAAVVGIFLFISYPAWIMLF